MFGWLKKKKPKCQHTKKFGDSYPTNMEKVIIFNDGDEIFIIPYGVAQCNECGSRVFSCLYLHLMPTDLPIMIDRFIAYEVELSALTDMLDGYGYYYKLEKESQHG